MNKYARLVTFVVLSAIGAIGTAHAAMRMVPGEWETTSQVATPQGRQTLHEKVCNKGHNVAEILMRQQGTQCAPWHESGSDAAGAYVLQSTCTQAGAFPGGVLTLHALARVTVAPDGRSARGTVQASGHVNGMPFTSPPTPFSSRYLGACSGQ